jgi:hypothetical protein
MKLDYDGLAFIKWFNKTIKKLNPDTTLDQRKKFIVDEVTHHKYMSEYQAKKFVRELK